MKKLFASFGILIVGTFLTSTSYAAEPKVPAKLSLSTGQLQRLEVPVDKDKKLVYKSSAADDELFVDELVAKEGKVRLLLQGTKPGIYYVAFLYTDSPSDIVFCKIIVGGATPPNPDDIKPKPPTPPLPTAGKLKAYIITESADKNINFQKMLSGKDIQAYWKAKQFGDIVIADPNTKDTVTGQTPVKLKPYIDRAAGKADQLYLVDITTGDIFYDGNSPQSETDFLTLLKKLSGG